MVRPEPQVSLTVDAVADGGDGSAVSAQVDRIALDLDLPAFGRIADVRCAEQEHRLDVVLVRHTADAQSVAFGPTDSIACIPRVIRGSLTLVNTSAGTLHLTLASTSPVYEVGQADAMAILERRFRR